mmetsp:Transcript_23842/g.52231  ORF Transcript_23842/g.52231 Transcript_23842/m.52231 type:complete len:278 (-) Transcript_23842:104-937(-)
MLNLPRVLGDLLHLCSRVWLIRCLVLGESCRGLSLRTQELYLVIFLTRYSDLLLYFLGWYNTLFKITYLLSAIFVVVLIRLSKTAKQTYDRTYDKPAALLCFTVPCLLLSAYTTTTTQVNPDWFEYAWQFSICLESVALVPQIWCMYKTENYAGWLVYYLIMVGLYRLFYILNWCIRIMTEGSSQPFIAWVAAYVQGGVFAVGLLVLMRQQDYIAKQIRESRFIWDMRSVLQRAGVNPLETAVKGSTIRSAAGPLSLTGHAAGNSSTAKGTAAASLV